MLLYVLNLYIHNFKKTELMSKLISTNTLETAEQSLVQKIMIETGIGYLANALLFYAFVGLIRLSHTA